MSDNKETYTEIESHEPIGTDELFEQLAAENPAIAEALSEAEPELILAQLVTQLRLFRGLTQKELGERIGKQQSAIARIENGSVNTGWSTVFELFSSLGFSLHLTPNEADVAMVPRKELEARLDAAQKQGFADGMSSAGTLHDFNASKVGQRAVVALDWSALGASKAHT